MSLERFTELGEVHAELQILLRLIETETNKSAPDMIALSAVRLKLTQASRRRSMLVNDLVDTFAPQGSAETKAQLARLRQALQQARFRSAQHIGQWTTRSITQDWGGYRAASEQIRTTMRAQLHREAAVLRSLASPH